MLVGCSSNSVSYPSSIEVRRQLWVGSGPELSSMGKTRISNYAGVFQHSAAQAPLCLQSRGGGGFTLQQLRSNFLHPGVLKPPTELQTVRVKNQK